MITLGQLISSVIALVCGRDWRLMLGIAGIPAMIQLVCMIYMSESQRYLAKKKRTDACLKTLRKVYPEECALAELQVLQKEVDENWKSIQMTEWQRYKQLFTTYKRCLVVGCGLQFFQQFIGINTIMYYGPEIII